MYAVAVLCLVASVLASEPPRPDVAPGRAKDSNKCWPRENFMFPSAAGGCPDKQWDKGHITWYMYRNSTVPDTLDADVSGSYLTVNFCGHAPDKTQEGCNDDNTPAAFPQGSYCLYMYKLYEGTKITQNCPAGFKWSWLAIDDVDNYNRASHGGHVPLGEFFSFSTVSYYCCRNDGDANKEITLPTGAPFVLFPTQKSKTCQKVKGMTVKKDEIFYSSEDLDAESNGAPGGDDFPPPDYSVDVPKGFWGLGLRLSTCTYTPNGQKAKVSARKNLPSKKQAPVCWPNVNFGLLSTKEGCPEGWGEGSVTHWEKPGGQSQIPDYVKGSVEDQAVTLNYCMHGKEDSKNTPSLGSSCTSKNRATWGPGSYCFFHYNMSETAVFDKSCPTGFFYNWFVIDDVNKDNGNTFKGEIPSGEFYDYASVYYACCRNDGNVDVPISLPTEKPFVLLPTATDRKCQAVNGMKATYGEIFYDSEDGDADVVPTMKEPYIPIDYTIDNPKGKWGAGMREKVCYYTKA